MFQTTNQIICWFNGASPLFTTSSPSSPRDAPAHFCEGTLDAITKLPFSWGHIPQKAILPSGYLTSPWKIPYKWRFQWENHL